MKPEKVNVNCGLCGKHVCKGDPRAKHFHMECMEKDMAAVRKTQKSKWGEPTVKCPKYEEPVHKCRIKKG